MRSLINPCMLLNLGLLLLLLAGCKKAPKGEFFDDALSLDVSKALQGFCAVAIVLHHLSQVYANDMQSPIACLDWICNGGVFFTAFFFFFSGYGLIISYKSKPDYLNGFLKKRLITVLVPFYLAEWLFTLAAYFMEGPFSLSDALVFAVGLRICNGNLWYIVEICVLYAAFYLIFSRVKNEKRALLYMLFFTLALICFSVLRGHAYDIRHIGSWFMGEWWFNTTLCFPLGMAVAMYKEPLFKFIKTHYALCISASLLVFILLHLASMRIQFAYGYYTESETSRGIGDKFLTLLFQAPEVMAFLISFLLLTLKLRVSNKALRFVGGFALELYASHNIYVRYPLALMPWLSSIAHMLLCYALALPTAYLLHRLCVRVKAPLLARAGGVKSAG